MLNIFTKNKTLTFTTNASSERIYKYDATVHVGYIAGSVFKNTIKHHLKNL